MRRLAPLLLIVAGLGIALVAASRDPGQAQVSFAPLFELAGRAPQSMNRVVGQAMGVDPIDEAALGRELEAAWANAGEDAATRTYVQEVLDTLTPHAHKPFPYRVHLVAGPPNAMALPGGVILVTTGLMQTLDSEAELAAVLAHELGHVELSHCLDAAAFDLAARKGGGGLARGVGALRDLLVAHTYSQTQEAEADEYGFTVLVDSAWDPGAMAEAFARLATVQPDRGGAPNPFRDYLLSHPPLDHREAEFREKARAWWADHPDALRISGKVSWAPARHGSWEEPGDVVRGR